METTFNKPQSRGLVITFMLSVLAICAKAQGAGKFVSNLTNDLSKDGEVSLYIIGGIAVFGAVIFGIKKILSKYQKEEPQATKPFYNKHHHHQHHRTIKKTS